MATKNRLLRRLYNRRHITSAGCWEWIGWCSRKGYGMIRVDGKAMAVHRVSFKLHGGRCTRRKPMVLHTCDNPPCFNPEHLYAGNARRNALDVAERTGWPDRSGEHNQNCKLTDGQVAEIRCRYVPWSRGQASANSLAAEYGVGAAYISWLCREERHARPARSVS